MAVGTGGAGGPGRGGAGGRPGAGGWRGPRPPAWEDMRRPWPYDAHPRVPWRPEPQDNLGLWLDKLVPRQWSPQPGGDRWALEKEHRAWALEQMFCVDPSPGSAGPRVWESRAGKEALERVNEAVALWQTSFVVRARVVGRLLVDLGRANSAETSLSFHHIWGVPRIPGSAVKGMLRSYLKEGGIDADLVRTLFGAEPTKSTSGSQGRLVFLDALPEGGRFSLALDVLTPHYGKYYQDAKNETPPGDWLSPVPFTFLTVVETTFVFHVAAPAGAAAVADGDMRRVRASLVEALWEIGLGAKRAAGYGRLWAQEEA